MECESIEGAKVVWLHLEVGNVLDKAQLHSACKVQANLYKRVVTDDPLKMICLKWRAEARLTVAHLPPC